VLLFIVVECIKELIEATEAAGTMVKLDGASQAYKDAVSTLPQFARHNYDTFWAIMASIKKKGLMHWRIQKNPKYCENCIMGREVRTFIHILALN